MSVLDGPSKQGLLAVTTAALTEVKIGASAFEERQVVTLQPLGGSIRIYFADEGVVPTVGTVASDGFLHFKNQKDTYEATCTQVVYILAENSSFNVVLAERA